MAVNTKIQWAQSTWNPWYGCRKVSPGCKFCYAERDMTKFGQDFKQVRQSKTKFSIPLKWVEPRLIFTCSWSDWFIEDADPWRPFAWKIIKQTPQHTYQILTKRSELIADRLPSDWGDGYPNVWLGVSVESNAQRHRITELAKIPAAVRFISAEPLIDQLDLLDLQSKESVGVEFIKYFHWVIVGGESGNDEGKHRYRECYGSWINHIIYDCQRAKVPIFVKQMGTALAKKMGLKDRQGGNIDEWPEEFKIRQMPKHLPVELIP